MDGPLVSILHENHGFYGANADQGRHHGTSDCGERQFLSNPFCTLADLASVFARSMYRYRNDADHDLLLVCRITHAHNCIDS
jgi:hypothetical protein